MIAYILIIGNSMMYYNDYKIINISEQYFFGHLFHTREKNVNGHFKSEL